MFYKPKLTLIKTMKILIFLVSLILYGKKKKIRQDQAKYNGKSLPFYGGWFIYLGYEIAKEIEKKIQIPKSGFFFLMHLQQEFILQSSMIT